LTSISDKVHFYDHIIKTVVFSQPVAIVKNI